MYSLVNLAVSPSRFIQTAMYGVLCSVMAVSIFYLHAQPLFLLMFAAVLLFYFYKVYARRFVFQRARQWQIKNNTLYLILEQTSEEQSFSAEKIKLLHLQLWRSVVLFSYQCQGKTHQEIISLDAVDHEDFRKFRCMIKQLKP